MVCGNLPSSLGNKCVTCSECRYYIIAVCSSVGNRVLNIKKLFLGDYLYIRINSHRRNVCSKYEYSLSLVLWNICSGLNIFHDTKPLCKDSINWVMVLCKCKHITLIYKKSLSCVNCSKITHTLSDDVSM